MGTGYTCASWSGAAQTQLEERKPVHWCRPPVLDAVFSSYFLQAQRQDIRIEADITLPDALPVTVRAAPSAKTAPVTSAPEATIRLAQLLLDRGDNENAARYFTRAVTLCATPELQPFRIHAYVGLGRAALAQGQKELALRYWMTTAFMYHEPEVLPPIIRESIALAESLGKTEEAESLRKTLAEYN